MTQSAETVLQNLQQGIYAPIYFLQGEELYYIDSITQYIAEELLTSAEKNFNLTIFYGKECSIQTLLTQARRFPINATRQVVIVKEAQEMADLKNLDNQKVLCHYLQHPQPTTVLVFAYKYKTLDGRSTLHKTLTRHAVMVTAKKLYDQQLPAFIQALVQKMSCTITKEAIWMMLTYIGNDLTKISHELHKLAINLPKSSNITVHTVATYIDLYQPFKIFALQKAILQKDYAKSYQIMSHSASTIQEHAALPIVTLLYNCFSKLVLLHESNHTTPTQLAQQIEVPPYFIQDYLDALKAYSLHQTLQNITYLHQADLQLKGIESNLQAYEIMKTLIFKLTHDIHGH